MPLSRRSAIGIDHQCIETLHGLPGSRGERSSGPPRPNGPAQGQCGRPWRIAGPVGLPPGPVPWSMRSQRDYLGDSAQTISSGRDYLREPVSIEQEYPASVPTTIPPTVPIIAWAQRAGAEPDANIETARRSLGPSRCGTCAHGDETTGSAGDARRPRSCAREVLIRRALG